jgi:hypothetical protein
MKKINGIASVYFNGDFFQIWTMSRAGLRYADPDVEPFYLEPDVDNQVLGNTLRIALSKSKEIVGIKFMEIFKSGRVQEKDKEENKKLMKQYGYKTKRALYKNMDKCSISVFEGNIEIQPTHHDSLDGYSANQNKGPFALLIPETATDEELGAAVREGFTRCTSIFK